MRWEALRGEGRHHDGDPGEVLARSLHRERGPMVVDDLRALPHSPLVVAEGTTVPAAAVSSGLAERSRAVWLIPTLEFQRDRLDERGGPAAEQALFRLLAETIESEASDHDAPILSVDISRGIEEMVAAVEERFGAAIAAGPTAQTTAERRALLRHANEAIVSQCLGFLARPWSHGDAESFEREFVCECDDPECAEGVELAVAAFVRASRTGTVLAAAHS